MEHLRDILGKRNAPDFLKVAKRAIEAHGPDPIPDVRNYCEHASGIAWIYARHLTRRDLEAAVRQRENVIRAREQLAKVEKSLELPEVWREVERTYPLGWQCPIETVKRLRLAMDDCLKQKRSTDYETRVSKEICVNLGIKRLSPADTLAGEHLVKLYRKLFGVEPTRSGNTARSGNNYETAYMRWAGSVMNDLGVPFKPASIVSAMGHARRGQRRSDCLGGQTGSKKIKMPTCI